MIYVPTLEELKIFVPDDIQSRENKRLATFEEEESS